VVDALRETGGVARGRVPILPAAVELVLLLVETVHQVAGATAGQPSALRDPVGGEDPGCRTRRIGRLDEVVDRERRVLEVARERLGRRRVTSRTRRSRSEEHTSELQSPYDLVCRL